MAKVKSNCLLALHPCDGNTLPVGARVGKRGWARKIRGIFTRPLWSPNRHQPDTKLINIRRGEGGEEWRGGAVGWRRRLFPSFPWAGGRTHPPPPPGTHPPPPPPPPH